MSIEELKAVVSEALEADLFDLTHIELDETDEELNEETYVRSCVDCNHYDEYLFECDLKTCPYIKEDDELEGQQYLY